MAGVAGAVGVEGDVGKTVGCAALRGRSVIPPREEGTEVSGRIGTTDTMRSRKGQDQRER